MKNKVYEIITDKIICELKKGNLTWLKDWSNGFGVNYISRKAYSGINAILINISLISMKYKNNEWLTFNQIKKLKGSLKKGSKATPIIYYAIIESCSCGKKNCQEPESEKHIKNKHGILRYYNVFNIDDTDLPSKTVKKEHTPDRVVEYKLSRYWDLLNNIHLGNPSYNPMKDTIFMPDIGHFDTRNGYYSALTHELIHSTGHESRLKRKGIVEPIGVQRDKYAYEELIAEIGSAFLCAELGIENDITNTSAYVQSWLSALQNNKRFIFQASAEAQKAQKYIVECFENVSVTEIENLVIEEQEKPMITEVI